MSEQPWQVIIVDDHPVMRMGLSQLVSSVPEFQIAGEAGTADGALDLLDHLDRVDMALVDVSLPDRSGLELVKDIVAMHSGLKCLVISSHDESVYAERILRAGAKGYITKDRAPDQLIEAIRMVREGGIFLSPEMTAKLMKLIAEGSRKSSGVSGLTDRELEVFLAIGEGKTPREISGQLGISLRTVDAHRTNIKDKLELRDSSELTYEAIRWVESQA